MTKKFSEVRCDHLDLDGFWHVDAWETDDDNEEGSVVAMIDNTTARVAFIDGIARTDELVLETINNMVEKIKKEKKTKNDEFFEGTIKAKNGTFSVVAGLEEDYPGVDIEFEIKNCRACTMPRIVFEEAAGVLRLLIWGNPELEDYTEKIEFDIEKYKKGKNKDA